MASHMNPLAHGLIRDDAKSYFLNFLEQIYDVWIPLLDKTTLRPNDASDDLRLGDAFRALDKHIASSDPVQSRLGAVQLTKLMALLKMRIKADRRSGRIAAKKRGDSVAIDAYVQARGPLPDRGARDQALKHVRMSKRWHDLTRSSPLLAVIHTPKAEQIVSDIRVPNATLIQLGLDIRGQYPPELAEAADYLVKIGEAGVQVEAFRSDHLGALRGILGSSAVEDFDEIQNG